MRIRERGKTRRAYVRYLTALAAKVLAVMASVPLLCSAQSNIVLGSVQPNYQFPWVVRVTGNLSCHGTLIGPHWVLTAAHCFPTMQSNVSVRYSRTSPNGVVSGAEVFEGTRVYVHPQYDAQNILHDIALIQLREPLDAGHPDPYLRAVELPLSNVSLNENGIMASTIRHTSALPPGTVAVLNGSVVGSYTNSFDIRSAEASLCPGDSGSGFIRAAGTRTFVTGVASNIPSSGTTCVAANVPANLTSVYAHLDWIGQITRLGEDIQGTGDFDGDGIDDILLRNSRGTVIIWFMNGGTIRTRYSLSIAPFLDWQIQGTGDFNGDGKSDILWRNSSGAVAIWLMNSWFINPVSPSTVPGNDWQIQRTGDFNADRKSDILWRNSTGTVAIWLMSGGTIQAQLYPGAPGNDWKIQGAGDFNDDNKADILWRNIDGTVAIWLMNGGTILAQLYPGAPGNDWKIQGTGDFNNNGKSDILWRNNDGTVAIWLMNGSTIAAQFYPGAPGNDWQIRGTADFNDNGKSDILWKNNDGTVAIWFMNGGTVEAYSYPLVP